MKLPKKLSKIKVDIVFFNPDTRKRECSFNQCYKKFEAVYEDVAIFPEWLDEARQIGILFKSVTYECNECGRSHSNKKTRGISINNYSSSISGGGEKVKRDEWKGKIYFK